MIKIKDNYVVYAHINKVNGKMYIGLTKQKVNLRWGKGSGYKGHAYFYNAIQKYGWDNFEHEIIASGLTKEEASNFEKLLIKKLDTTNDEKGYNLDKGGTYGLHSESSKEKMRGSKNPSSRKIICVTTGEIFDTMTEASKFYPSTSRRSIGCCCEKTQKTAGNFDGQKLQWMYYEEYLKFGNTCKDADIYDYGKQIICLNNGKIYYNCVQASKELNLSIFVIRECCSLAKKCVKDNDNNEFYFMDYNDYLKYGEFDFKLRHSKKVYCKTNNTIYSSINNVYEKLNLSARAITIACNTKLYKNEIIDVINKDNVIFNFEYDS